MWNSCFYNLRFVKVGLRRWKMNKSTIVFLAGSLCVSAGIASAEMNTKIENRFEAQDSQDSQIKADVMEELSSEPVFSHQGIYADVKSGIIRLKGEASSNAVKEHAARIAERVTGAQRIINEISVIPTNRLGTS